VNGIRPAQGIALWPILILVTLGSAVLLLNGFVTLVTRTRGLAHRCDIHSEVGSGLNSGNVCCDTLYSLKVKTKVVHVLD